MQYSYLPSWLSYLVDQDRARDAGRELFDAVYARWSDLPAGRPAPPVRQRREPRLVRRRRRAFSGEFDLRNRTSGALLAGPAELQRRSTASFVDDRDPGSTEVAPVFRDGRTVRFSTDPDQPVPPVGEPWNDARVLYMQHPSDPVVWWNTDLILARPDWLEEPRGRDVVDAVHWIPFVTFWQVTFDLPFALDVPPGHGHSYSREYVDGWLAVLQPRARRRLRLGRRPRRAVARRHRPAEPLTQPARGRRGRSRGRVGVDRRAARPGVQPRSRGAPPRSDPFGPA